MSLEIACPACHGKFRVPETAAGKKIRCPKCKGAIDVPAPATKAASQPDEWYLKDEEGNNYGPVPRSGLDAWYEEGRITADCQLLLAGQEQWQWASDVYSDLEEDQEEDQEEVQEEQEDEDEKKQDEDQAQAPVWRPAPLVKIPAPAAAVADIPQPIVTQAIIKTSPVRSKPSPRAAPPDEDAPRSSRSKAIAGLLGIFLGPLGTHRFYLGYWGLGLAMLFTAGGCGVWSLVDAVLVILGRVPDADGRPLSE